MPNGCIKPAQVYIHLQQGLYFFVRFVNMAIQNFSGRFITIGYRFHPFEGEVSFSSFFPKLGISSFCCNLESAESHPFVVVCTMFMFFFQFWCWFWETKKNQASKPCWTNMPPWTSWKNSLPPCSVVPPIDPKHPRWIDSDVVLDWKFALDLSELVVIPWLQPDLGNLQFFPGKILIIRKYQKSKATQTSNWSVNSWKWLYISYAFMISWNMSIFIVMHVYEESYMFSWLTNDGSLHLLHWPKHIATFVDSG